MTGEELYNFKRDWYIDQGALAESIPTWDHLCSEDPREACCWDDMAAVAGSKPPLLLEGAIGRTTEEYLTGTRQRLTNVHFPITCEGSYCVIHNPSDHPLRDAPTHWRPRRLDTRRGEIMERICPHGNFHPDPDDLAFIARNSGDEKAKILADHDCCGCCKEEEE